MTTPSASDADTFPKLLAGLAKTRAHAAAYREKEYGIWQTYDWAHVAEQVNRLAAGLADLGFGRGDRLIVIGDNRPRLYWSMCAAQSLGGVPVPVYQDSVTEELAYVVEHAGARFALEQSRDEVDCFGRRSLFRHGGGKIREARRFRDNQPMQCDRVRGQRGAQDKRCQSKEDLLDARTLEQRRIGGRTQSINDPMDHRSEQRGLVFEAVIEGALRNACSSRDRLDARRTIAMAQKLVRRDVEDPLAELLRCHSRRTPPAAGETPVRVR